ncbi:nuclear transport factor 2 family protein [Cribrihabitans neustonicus]|uniref:nuclear transport factor 2 family protein n=1 Tax=Cribrihabitans neustonicus TaxID=1429085 RepID=UPI003B5B41A6
MTDSLHLLLSAWGDPSPGSRAAKADAAAGPNFYYSDPNAPGPEHGRAAFLDYIAQFGAMLHGYYFAGSADGKAVLPIGFAGMGEPA